MKNISLFIICVFLLGRFGFSQNIQKTISEFQDNTKAKVTINENTGIVEFVKFPINNALRLNGSTLKQKIIKYLQDYKGIYNLNDVGSSFIIDEIVVDNYGLRHLTAKQMYNGVPVYDGKLKFHFDKLKCNHLQEQQ